MNNSILKKVIEVICKIAKISPEVVTFEMSLDSPEIGLSSLDIVEVLVELESVYNIQFDSDVTDIKLIKNIVSIIETKRWQSDEKQKLIDDICNDLFGEAEGI